MKKRLKLLELCEYAFGVAQKLDARICQLNALASSVKNCCADFVFKLFYALAKVRLTDIKLFCRSSNTLFFFNLNNVSELL